MIFGRRCLYLLLLLILLLTGCAQSKYRFEYAKSVEEYVWPAPPEKARYQFAGYVYGESNLKKIEGSEGALRRFFGFIGETLFGKSVGQHLYRPQGGFVDNVNQRLFVTDVGKKMVFIFNLQSGQMTQWEGIDQFTPFKSPIAVVAGPDDSVFISDSELGLVALFDADGNLIRKIGESKLERPVGLATDREKRLLYVADSASHQILVYDFEGQPKFSFGGKGAAAGELNSPTYLFLRNGKLFVSDTLNARVQVFDADGNWLSQFGERGLNVGDLPRPKGIALDSKNHIYVIESFYDFLLVYDENGRGLLAIGGQGSQPGQFYLPAGVWSDNRDRIYVADMFNSRVAVFQYLTGND